MPTRKCLKKSTSKAPVKNLPNALIALLVCLSSRKAVSCVEVDAVTQIVNKALGAVNPRVQLNRSFGQTKRYNPSFCTNILTWLDQENTKKLASAGGCWWALVEWHRAFSEMARGVKPSVAWHINGRPADPCMRDAEEAGIYSIYLHRNFGLCKSNADMQAATAFGVDEAAVRRDRKRYDGLDDSSVIQWVQGTFSKYKMDLP